MANNGDQVQEQDKPRMDKAWDELVGMSRRAGFLGVSWKTVVIKPPDKRQISFDGVEAAHTGTIKRSIPITSLSFVEVRFTYEGRPKKRTPVEVKEASKHIEKKIGEILRIG